MGKRLAADAAPGEDIPNSTNKTFNISHVADNYIQSKYQNYLNKESPFFLNRDKRPLSDQSVRQMIKKYQN